VEEEGTEIGMSDTKEAPQATAANGNGAIVKGPAGRLQTLKTLFEKSKGSIAAVLPKHLTPERLIKIATSAASRTPLLLECTPESVLLAVVQAGTLGLEPNTPLHQCALVPLKNGKTGKMEAVLWIEYRGLCQLAYQSGEVLDIYAHTVCENDEFDFDLGTKKRIFHRYDIRKPRGAGIAYYAVVKFKSGGEDFDVMSRDEVEKIRSGSMGKDSDAWVKNFDAMGEKTVIRRVLKTAPMSQDKAQPLARALDVENRNERGATPDYSEIVDVIGEVVDPETGEVSNEPTTRTDAMKERLAAKAS
jgi:recombination protein RecT